MDTATDTRPPEETAVPGSGVSLSALQDTALRAVGLFIVLNTVNPAASGIWGIASLLSGQIPLANPAATLPAACMMAATFVGTVLLGTMGLVFLCRPGLVTRRLWPRDGQVPPSVLTHAEALCLLIGVISLYLLGGALSTLPASLWDVAVLAFFSGKEMRAHSSGGEGLFRSLFMITLCLVCLAKARPLGAWMARRAGLAG